MQTEQAEDRQSALQAGLAMHTGSETCYRHWAGSLRFTEGVKFLADEANAYWLIDNIAWSRLKAEVRREEFVLWKLVVHDNHTATLIAEDGNSRELLRQAVPWTDFPLKEISFYLTDNTLLLPGEY
ncbi:MAG: hypothetical protein KGH75_01585 [Rhodospirillales bacterium]|nr:hypothetical protein [Rhodospirillales bacterium]